MCLRERQKRGMKRREGWKLIERDIDRTIDSEKDREMYVSYIIYNREREKINFVLFC